MLVSSAVVRRLRGDIGDISISQMRRQLHLPPELTVGSNIFQPFFLLSSVYFSINLWIFLFFCCSTFRLVAIVFRHPIANDNLRVGASFMAPT